MRTTLDLLSQAEKAWNGSTRALSIKLGLRPTTLQTAKDRGHLSPSMAAIVARALGEDEVYWTAVAGLESDKPSRARDEALKAAAKWKKGSPEGALAGGGEGGIRTHGTLFTYA
jgi:hypothetical protein